MSNIATTIEQSKELLGLGLPAESADMYYQKVLPKSDKIEHNPKVGNPVAALEWYNKGYTHFGESPLILEEFCVPAWSLSALLEVMPKPDLYRETADLWVCVTLFKEGSIRGFGETAIDATYDVITKMFERGYLKKKGGER